MVPPYAESFYMIRAPQPDQLKPIYERVLQVAQGAALMAGTEVEPQLVAAASNIVYNGTIFDVLMEKMGSITPPTFSNEEKQFAQGLSETFPEGGVDSGFARLLGPEILQILKKLRKAELFDGVLPAFKKDVTLPGSSDVGDVSWVTPIGQIMTTCQAFGTPAHSWQQVAQSGMGIGHKGMLYAGKILAMSALEFLQKPELISPPKTQMEVKKGTVPFFTISS